VVGISRPPTVGAIDRPDWLDSKPVTFIGLSSTKCTYDILYVTRLKGSVMRPLESGLVGISTSPWTHLRGFVQRSCGPEPLPAVGGAYAADWDVNCPSLCSGTPTRHAFINKVHPAGAGPMNRRSVTTGACNWRKVTIDIDFNDPIEPRDVA
jgi:hypothetical protein